MGILLIKIIIFIFQIENEWPSEKRSEKG